MCLFTDVIRHYAVVRLGVDCVCLPLSFLMSAPQAFPGPGRRGSRAVPAAFPRAVYRQLQVVLELGQSIPEET